MPVTSSRFQETRVPVIVNGRQVYLRGTQDFAEDGTPGAKTITDVVDRSDVVGLAGLSRASRVTYSDSTGSRDLAPGESVKPALDGSFVVLP